MNYDYTILFVDDEPHILNALKRLFRKENFKCLTAQTGMEGLLILEKEPVQIVVSDQRMPEMMGIEFLQEVKKRWPDTIRVILSGYAEIGVVIEAINKGEIYRFFSKPWNDDELKIKIRQCLTQYELIQRIQNLNKETEAQNQELQRFNDNLEEMIAEKSKSLELYQDIYFYLPVPVIGISQEGIIVLINNAFQKSMYYSNVSLETTISLGTAMEEIFPENIVFQVRECLNGNKLSDRIADEVNKIILNIQALRTDGEETNCLITMEKI